MHLALGVWALFAARDVLQATRFNRFNAWFYGILGICGLIPGLNTMFGLIPIFSHDVWLHFLFAGVTAYVGYGLGTRAEEVPSSYTGPTRRAG